MRFFYLIAALDEAENLSNLVSELSLVVNHFPGSQVFIVDNGSSDNSREVLASLMNEKEWLTPLFESEKGMGIAFRRGLFEIEKYGLTKDDWIAFNAADLPFGFSDLHSFLGIHEKHPEVFLFIGSKSHPQSKIARSWRRSVASFIFKVIRSLFLKMKTMDPQGTLFLRGDFQFITEKIQSSDYFFTTELVYEAEKFGTVIEIPIVLKPDRRASKVHLLRDGLKALYQIDRLRRRR